MAWGDYDNDGDLDLALCGYYYDTASHYISRIYRNSGGTFADSGAELTGVCYSCLAWGDYDSDGDLDLALTGFDGTAAAGKMYRNDAGAFTAVVVGVPAAQDGSLAWGDYDNDGDLDLAVTGYSSGYVGRICRNTGGTFVDPGVVIAKARYSSVAWGDYDNDGDLDLVVAGYDGSARIAKVYRNNAAAGLTGVRECSLAWGDYDSDGDLDLALAGYTGTLRISKIYRNDGNPANTPPTAPTNLSVSFAGNDLTFQWNAATDAQTPAAGLTYNLRVGTTPGDDDVFSGMANAASGLRLLPAIGNAQQKLAWTVRNLNPQIAYYWSAQAIDTALAGSAWAVEQLTANYEISGHVRDGSGSGIASVVLTATGGSSATTDGDGLYSLAVPAGWSGTVTPSKTACALNPTSRTYTNVTEDQADQDYQLTEWFANINAGLVGDFAIAWGDCDNDGDLDLALGRSYNSTKIYRNTHGVFTDIGAQLASSDEGCVAWGDCDNDGDLDLAASGWPPASVVYRNDAGTFNDVGAGIISLDRSSIDWGDYDNDGDLDMAIVGFYPYYVPTSKIYRSDGGSFTDIGAALTNVGYDATVAWGDYDNDGDLDLALAGLYSDYYPQGCTKVYRNDNGAFVDINAGLTGICSGQLAWGDYDSDGDLDLALTGGITPSPIYPCISKIYRNDGGRFVDIGAELTGVIQASISWGDFDNDGDLDLALSGTYGGRDENGQYWGVYVSKIYRNNSGRFDDIGAELTGLRFCSVAWGDYDNDGDLDLATAGNYYDTSVHYVSKIYRNGGGWPANSAPTPPAGLLSSVTGNEATFSWSAAYDAQTPAPGLSYNLRVGTSPGSDNIFSGMANPSTGARLLPATGNAQKRLSWRLRNLPVDSFYWSVQAIDGAFAGSTWAPEQSFTTTAARITGQIRDNRGVGIASVALAASNGGPNVITDEDGYYELLVPAGWSGGVTPSRAASAFDPLIRSYSNVTSDQMDQDYTVTKGFTEVESGVVNVKGGSVAWGDYDADGDLDLAIAGDTLTGYSGNPVSKIYRNDGGILADAYARLRGLGSGACAAWGDYDRDGDLDLAITGSASTNYYLTKVYRNDNGAFIDTNASVIGVYDGYLAWGDCDNDGDLDLAITGNGASSIYRNNGGSFVGITAGLLGLYESRLNWGDYDNDGDLDLALAGRLGVSSRERVSKIYRNDAGSFVDSGVSLAGVCAGSIVWGDYDNDGDLDLALTGYEDMTYYAESITKIYRNNGGVLSDIGAAIAGVVDSSLAWGDYDNDGDLDVIISGDSQFGCITRVYRNTNGFFANTGTGFLDGSYSSLSLGDFDNDGDLDLALCAQVYGRSLTRVYRNDCAVANSSPTSPTNLSNSTNGSNVVFSWNAAIDAETPAAGLSYNLRVGTSPGASNVFSGMANPSTGYRRIPALGNAQKRLSWTLRNVPSGPLYWSAQAIDTAFAGSAWAPEQSTDEAFADVNTAKRRRDGTQGTLSGVVTAVFGNAFYIEALDRSNGIRAEKSGHGLAIGMMAQVTGVVKTNSDFERYVEVTTITPGGAGVVEAVMLNNKALGGGDFEYNPLTGAGQRGVEDGSGLNNIGLLVVTTGRVTASGDGFFYVDDGTHARDASIFSGVRVLCDGMQKPEPGAQVSVAGISSIINMGGRVFRSVRARGQADVDVLE